MSTPEANTLKEKFKKLVPWIEEDIMFCLANAAQEEIEQIKNDEDKHAQALIKQRDDAELKIEAAKQILAELPAYKYNAMGWEMYERKEIDEWVSRLSALLIPRKENQTEAKKNE